MVVRLHRVIGLTSTIVPVSMSWTSGRRAHRTRLICGPPSLRCQRTTDHPGWDA